MARGEELSVDLRTWIVVARKNWKRYKATSKQFLVPVSIFLTIVKKYREFQTVENPERRGRRQKLSPRNVWKTVCEINFNPSFKSTLHSHLSKFSTQRYRGYWEKSFTGCRQRKSPLLQNMQIKALLYFVNMQLDRMSNFGHQYNGETRRSCEFLGYIDVAFVWREKVKLKKQFQLWIRPGWWKLDVFGLFLGQYNTKPCQN